MASLPPSRRSPRRWSPVCRSSHSGRDAWPSRVDGTKGEADGRGRYALFETTGASAYRVLASAPRTARTSPSVHCPVVDGLALALGLSAMCRPGACGRSDVASRIMVALHALSLFRVVELVTSVPSLTVVIFWWTSVTV